MNLIEYLHYQTRVATKILTSERDLSANSLLELLGVLNQPLCADYLREYASPSSMPESETDDAVVTNEMGEFFKSGKVPLSFLFERAQRQFSQQMGREVERQLKGKEVKGGVEDSYEELRTDVSQRVVGVEFRLKLARKICFLIDSLFWICVARWGIEKGKAFSSLLFKIIIIWDLISESLSYFIF